MTSTETLAKLTELANEMPARVQQGSTKEIAKFTALLSTVDDFPPAEFARSDIDLIRTLTERVIEQVEMAIEISDSPRRQQKLASTVYELQRTLEGIGIWHRPFEKA